MAKDAEGNEILEEGGEPGEGGGAQVDETKYIPIERFNQVYKQSKDYERMMADYKKYGTPEEVRARHEKLTQWEKAVDEAKKAANATPDEKAAAEQAVRVRKELLRIMPELANLTKITELEQKYEGLSAGEAESVAKEVLAGHSAAFTPLLKEAGIDLKYQNEVEEFLASKMSDEDKIAFLQGDFDVIKPYFEAAVKEGLLSAIVKKAAPIPPALRNPAGGTGLKAGAKKPMTLKEAEELGWQRMNSGGE